MSLVNPSTRCYGRLAAVGEFRPANGRDAAASFRGSAWGHDQRPGADLSWRNTGARASSTKGRGAAAGQGTRRGARTPRQGTDRLVGWVALGLHLTPDHRGHRRGDPRLPGNLHDPVGARLVDVAVLLAVENAGSPRAPRRGRVHCPLVGL